MKAALAAGGIDLEGMNEKNFSSMLTIGWLMTGVGKPVTEIDTEAAASEAESMAIAAYLESRLAFLENLSKPTPFCTVDGTKLERGSGFCGAACRGREGRCGWTRRIQ